MYVGLCEKYGAAGRQLTGCKTPAILLYLNCIIELFFGYYKQITFITLGLYTYTSYIIFYQYVKPSSDI